VVSQDSYMNLICERHLNTSKIFVTLI